MYINKNLKLRGMKINFSGPFIIQKIKKLNKLGNYRNPMKIENQIK
jgi:hypothetical protein